MLVCNSALGLPIMYVSCRNCNQTLLAPYYMRFFNAARLSFNPPGRVEFPSHPSIYSFVNLNFQLIGEISNLELKFHPTLS